MQREIKIWGERWLARKDSTHAISYLMLLKGYRCSWHRHREKYNLFVVLSGQIGVLVEELGEKKEVILNKGECLTVKPGQWHEFRVYEDSQVIEEMYVEYAESDIERAEVGGLING